MSGRVEEARVICARLMQLKPALRISGIKDKISQGGRYRKIVASLPDGGHAGMSTPRRLAVQSRCRRMDYSRLSALMRSTLVG